MLGMVDFMADTCCSPHIALPPHPVPSLDHVLAGQLGKHSVLQSFAPGSDAST